MVVIPVYTSHLRLLIKVYKNLANLSVSSFDNTDVYVQRHSAYERKRLELHQEFLQLLLQLADREEEEAQQIPDISRPMRRRRLARRRVWCRTQSLEIFDNLRHELNREDPANYKNFLQVDADLFGEILDRNSPNSTKELLRVIYRFLRAVCVLLRAVYDSYKSFTEKPIH